MAMRSTKSRLICLKVSQQITHLLALNSSKTTIADQRRQMTSGDGHRGIKAAVDQWHQSIKSAYYHATKSQQPGHIYKEVLLACALAEADDLEYFAAADVRGPPLKSPVF